uniref:Uncharacterized protein n=1 Tax=Timema douglasi TaxID=61478 RepID=A0A7R8VFU1_TIMDO|nr:unnamed protein product [Timema douglasi]
MALLFLQVLAAMLPKSGVLGDVMCLYSSAWRCDVFVQECLEECLEICVCTGVLGDMMCLYISTRRCDVFVQQCLEVSLPLTKQKKVRCYQEKKQESDDRNYEIEQFTKNTMTAGLKMSTSTTTTPGLKMSTSTTTTPGIKMSTSTTTTPDYDHNTRAKDVNVYDHNTRAKDVNVYDHNSRDSYTNTYDMGNIPRFRFDSLSAQIESNDPPELPGEKDAASQELPVLYQPQDDKRSTHTRSVLNKELACQGLNLDPTMKPVLMMWTSKCTPELSPRAPAHSWRFLSSKRGRINYELDRLSCVKNTLIFGTLEHHTSKKNEPEASNQQVSPGCSRNLRGYITRCQIACKALVSLKHETTEDIQHGHSAANCPLPVIRTVPDSKKANCPLPVIRTVPDLKKANCPLPVIRTVPDSKKANCPLPVIRTVPDLKKANFPLPVIQTVTDLKKANCPLSVIRTVPDLKKANCTLPVIQTVPDLKKANCPLPVIRTVPDLKKANNCPLLVIRTVPDLKKANWSLLVIQTVTDLKKANSASCM